MALLPPSLLHSALYALFLLAVHYVWTTRNWRIRSRGRPLPPGPKPFPIVGNLFDIPKSSPWVGYRDLCTKYGEIIFFRTLGQNMIILGTYRAVSQLLEKRSANYSDRPQSIMIDLIGWEWDFGLMAYGQTWRKHRRLFWQHFHPGAISKYHNIQADTAHRLLRKLYISPEMFEEHIRNTFAAGVLKTVYGIDIAEKGDEIVNNIDAAMEGFSEGLTPGAFLVEYFPFLRLIPEWVPGAGFQQKFRRWRDASHKMVNATFALAKTTPRNPTKSIVGKILDGLTHLEGLAFTEEENIAKNVAAISYAGGADTTISTFQTFFLAMSIHPNVVAKAQTELMSVVGPNRLPKHADLINLPYVNAIVKECLRWQTAVPLSLPHGVVGDDEFDGYFIPAGTVVLPNIWAILHDPEIYPEPDKFIPERFLKEGKLNPDIRDPAVVAFGFGRRICPGRYFAEASLLIQIAHVLHVFDISRPLDNEGKVIYIQPVMKGGMLAYPEDCHCDIKPRSARAIELILSEG